MSNDLSVFGATARPAFAAKAPMSATTLALVGNTNSGKRISIKGGVFRLIHSGKEVTRIEDRFLDVVIVAAAAKVSRTFYGVEYDENATTPPKCWSADGDVPDASIANPCATNCMSCPNNAKGSGNGETRACRYSQRVAVVLANDTEGDVLQLTLPAASIFGKAEGDNRPLQEYARFMAAQNNDISMLVTRMRFDTNSSGPKLFFKPMRWLTEEEFADVTAAAESPEAKQAITYTVFSHAAGEAAPAIAGTKPAATPAPEALPKPIPAKKAVPAPVADADEEPAAPPPKARTRAKPAPLPDDEGGAPAPVVRKAAAVAAPAVAAGLADVLGEWDDE